VPTFIKISNFVVTPYNILDYIRPGRLRESKILWDFNRQCSWSFEPLEIFLSFVKTPAKIKHITKAICYYASSKS